MENKSATATVQKAYGKVLSTPITYDYSWTNYQTFEEVQTAKDELTNDEQVKVRNDERQSKARAAAQVKAFEAAGIVKPTLDTDEQLRLREMFKVLMSSKKYTEEAARALASTTLGIEWAE